MSHRRERVGDQGKTTAQDEAGQHGLRTGRRLLTPRDAASGNQRATVLVCVRCGRFLATTADGPESGKGRPPEPLQSSRSISSSEIARTRLDGAIASGCSRPWSDAPVASGSPGQSRSCLAAPMAVKKSLWQWHRAKAPHRRPKQQTWLESAHEVEELDPLGGRQRTRPSSGADEQREQTTALGAVELAEMMLPQHDHLSDQQQSGDRRAVAHALDPGRSQQETKHPGILERRRMPRDAPIAAYATGWVR